MCWSMSRGPVSSLPFYWRDFDFCDNCLDQISASHSCWVHSWQEGVRRAGLGSCYSGDVEAPFAILF